MTAPSRRGLPTGRLKGHLGRAGWSFVDQGLSSASNFGAGVVAARSSTSEQFGAFSIAFATAMIGIGVVRAIVSEVYSVRYAGDREVETPPSALDPDLPMGADAMAEWVELESEATAAGGIELGEAERGAVEEVPTTGYPHASAAWGASLFISLIASAGCLVAALLASGSLRGSFAILAVGMPALVLQDVVRYVCMARRDPFGAALSDGAWVVGFAVAIGVLSLDGSFPQANAALGAWVFGAGIGAAVGGLRMHAVPKLRQGWVFAHRTWRHSARYVLDWGALNATVQLSYYLLGVTAGLAVLGDLRAAMLLIGPLNIVVMGAVMILVPELTRFRRSTGNRLIVPAAAISIVLLVVALAWLAAVAVLPESVLETLLGDAASNARPLIPDLLVVLVISMLCQGPLVCLRATGDVRRGTRASLPAAPFQLCGAAVGAALLGGAGGALVGSASGYLVGGVLGSYQLVMATRSPPITFDQSPLEAEVR